jgi:hypothetical protein
MPKPHVTPEPIPTLNAVGPAAFDGLPNTNINFANRYLGITVNGHVLHTVVILQEAVIIIINKDTVGMGWYGIPRTIQTNNTNEVTTKNTTPSQVIPNAGGSQLRKKPLLTNRTLSLRMARIGWL